jgi:hypothetical protein
MILGGEKLADTLSYASIETIGQAFLGITPTYQHNVSI